MSNPSPERPISSGGWRNPVKNLTPEQRCKAHKKTGEQCQLPPINGTTVCGSHGGRAPQVKAKARQRLEEAADRMARELLRMADGSGDEKTKLAAIRDALDRAGLTAKQAMTVEHELKPWQTMFANLERRSRDAPESAETRARTHTAASHAYAGVDDDIIDAEVVHTCAGCGRTPPTWQEPPEGGWPEYCRACREAEPAEREAALAGPDPTPTPAASRGRVPPASPPPAPTTEQATAEAARVNRAAGVYRRPAVQREGMAAERRWMSEFGGRR
jgi:uncharacterized Zn finger protein (UPF0148 family)